MRRELSDDQLMALRMDRRERNYRCLAGHAGYEPVESYASLADGLAELDPEERVRKTRAMLDVYPQLEPVTKWLMMHAMECGLTPAEIAKQPPKDTRSYVLENGIRAFNSRYSEGELWHKLGTGTDCASYLSLLTDREAREHPYIGKIWKTPCSGGFYDKEGLVAELIAAEVPQLKEPPREWKQPFKPRNIIIPTAVLGVPLAAFARPGYEVVVAGGVAVAAALAESTKLFFNRMFDPARILYRQALED